MKKSNDTVYVGLDIGSSFCKVALLGPSEQVTLAHKITYPPISTLATRLIDNIMEQAGLPSSSGLFVTATGYGREGFEANLNESEIICHATAVSHELPHSSAFLDLGSQDIKLGWLDEAGNLRDFRMTDGCAAGTGYFLGALYDRLNVSPMISIDPVHLLKPRYHFVNRCAILAQSEVIGMLANGARSHEIIAAAWRLVAECIEQFLRGDPPPEGLTVTGGPVCNSSFVQLLEQRLGIPVKPTRNPIYAGAIGAALRGKRHENRC